MCLSGTGVSLMGNSTPAGNPPLLAFPTAQHSNSKARQSTE